MNVDGKTEIPTLGRQTIEAISRRIVSWCGPLDEYVDECKTGHITQVLIRIWLAGYQQGVLEESRRKP